MVMHKKVAVLLSGGVDSSVTAFLLKKQGYEVVAVTGKMFCSPETEQIVTNAKNVANSLGIEHFVCDVSEDFKTQIIDYFENSYKIGQTPNPCIMCNKKIKWGKIFDYAINELGADYIATGHYANIKEQNGIFYLYPAKDEKKDQLYYLFELNQEQLSKTIFPLHNLEKSEIRQIAEENNLPSKSSKDSQDICFITKPMTTKKFLAEKFGEAKGDFVLKSTGKKLGTHNGAWQFTIGQRKGIGLAYQEPLYVISTDVEKNIVYVGVKNELYSDSLKISNINFQSGTKLENFDAQIKVRYNMQKENAKISQINNEFIVEFDSPISAITKGQALVIYDKNDGHLIGGSWI